MKTLLLLLLVVPVGAEALWAAAPAAPPPKGLEAHGVGEQVKLGGATVVIGEMDNGVVVRNWCSDRFTFDGYGNEMLTTIRKQENLDAVLAKGKTEFQKQIHIMDWTFKRFKLFGPPGVQGVGCKPLAILKAVDQGYAFNCGYYADVCKAALRSCGFVARSIGLEGAKSDGNGSKHSILEMWSNDYRKWVAIDPLLNLYFTKAGVPLNAWEIRQEWFGNGGRDLVMVFGPEGVTKTPSDMPIARGTHPGFGTLKISPESLGKFLIILYIPNLPDGRYDYGKMFIFRDKLAEGVISHTRRIPTDPGVEPYFPLQQSALTLTPAAGRTLTVGVDTLTPDFAGYRHRIDGKPWVQGAPGPWSLHAGTNSLEVAAVTKFGIGGRPAKVVLEMK